MTPPVSPTRKTILFSTTRQWNPGDEFILFGVENILKAAGIAYMPVIYNRNPDVRSPFQDLQILKASKVPYRFEESAISRFIEANAKFGFFDNSIKPDTDCRFVDWVVFAGTPEWCNGRVVDLYSIIVKYNLPIMLLGVGGGYQPYRPSYQKVLEQAKIFTVRDRATLDAVQAAGMKAQLLPCPALLGAPASLEKQVTSVRKIGLIYQAAYPESVIWNGFFETSYRAMLAVYRDLLARFAASYEIELICHYIDEIPLARRDFPGIPLRYSYNAADYFDIYRDYDFVIGPRVHGIGAAASVGVPGLAFAHDYRGSTCEGFCADVVTDFTDGPNVLARVQKGLAEAPQRSLLLSKHKREVLQAYITVVQAARLCTNVHYDAPELVQPLTEYSLDNFGRIFQALLALFRDSADHDMKKCQPPLHQ